jgi:hypothetical protein
MVDPLHLIGSISGSICSPYPSKAQKESESEASLDNATCNWDGTYCQISIASHCLFYFKKKTLSLSSLGYL